MLKPAAQEVAAAAIKTLTKPVEAEDSSPAHLLESACRHGQGALDQVGRRTAVASEWAVRDGLAGRNR